MIKTHEFTLNDQSPLDLALLIYLINVGEITNEKVYEQFQIFAKLAKNCFVENGEEVYKAVFMKKNQGPFQLKDFYVSQVKYFPVIIDFFLRYYVTQC